MKNYKSKCELWEECEEEINRATQRKPKTLNERLTENNEWYMQRGGFDDAETSDEEEYKQEAKELNNSADALFKKGGIDLMVKVVEANKSWEKHIS